MRKDGVEHLKTPEFEIDLRPATELKVEPQKVPVGSIAISPDSRVSLDASPEASKKPIPLDMADLALNPLKWRLDGDDEIVIFNEGN